jgi:hypothetical protein
MSAETRVLNWNKLPSEYEAVVLINGHELFWKYDGRVMKFRPDQLIVVFVFHRKFRKHS